jgi:hypothetical protein
MSPLFLKFLLFRLYNMLIDCFEDHMMKHMLLGTKYIPPDGQIPILFLGDIQNFLYLFKLFSTTNISFCKECAAAKKYLRSI